MVPGEMKVMEVRTRRMNVANQGQRRTDVGRSPVTEDKPRPMSPGIQGQTVGDDVIRRRAYELYRQRGGQHGHDWDDWFRAEREFRQQRSRGKRESEQASLRVAGKQK